MQMVASKQLQIGWPSHLPSHTFTVIVRPSTVRSGVAKSRYGQA